MGIPMVFCESHTLCIKHFPSLISHEKIMNMIFRKRRKRNKDPMEIKLRNQFIPYKVSTLFLVITLDTRLNWEEHINKVKALNTTKVIAEKKWEGNRITLKRLYSACNMYIKDELLFQLYSTASPERLKIRQHTQKRYKNIHRRIYNITSRITARRSM